MIQRTRASARLRAAVVATLCTVSALLCLAGSAGADEFPCSEEGLDAAIAAAQTSPHGLSCTPGDVIQIHGGRWIYSSLILDLGGVTLECIEELPDHPCAYVLYTGSLCFYGPPREPPLCGHTTYDLSHFRLDGTLRIGYGDTTLRHVTITPPDDPLDTSLGIYVPSSNGAPGSAPTPAGELYLYDSSVSSNGDAILAYGRIRVERSTLSAMLPSAVGLRGMSYTTNVVDSTVEEMTIGLGGSLVNSTIAARSPDRPAYVDDRCHPSPANTTSANTIVDGFCVIGNDTCTGLHYSGALQSNGGNVEVGGDTCQFTDAMDQTGVTPEELALGPLEDNGGPTLTRALGEGSVAIDAAVLDACPDVDQRGAPRPEPGGVGCDAGAFELPEPDARLLAAVALGMAALLRRAAHHPRRPA